MEMTSTATFTYFGISRNRAIKSIIILCFILANFAVRGQQQQKSIPFNFPDKYSADEISSYLKLNPDEALWCLLNIFEENKEESYNAFVKFSKRNKANPAKEVSNVLFKFYPFDKRISKQEDSIEVYNTQLLSKLDHSCRQITEIFEEETEEKQKALLYCFISEDMERHRRLAEAYSYINKAIELDPRGRFYYNRALLKTQSLNYMSAIQDFDLLTRKYMYKVAESWFHKGENYNLLKQTDIAVKCYGKAIQADSMFIDAYNNRGTLLARQKDYAGALADFNMVLEHNPESFKAMFNRGFVFHKMGRKSEACQDWKAAGEMGFTPAIDNYFNNCKQ